MILTSNVLAVLLASCLALSAMAQQCVCAEQVDSSVSCLSFIGGGPACEAVTCAPYYICDSEGSNLCDVLTTAISVTRRIEGTGNCEIELVDPGTITRLVVSPVVVEILAESTVDPATFNDPTNNAAFVQSVLAGLPPGSIVESAVASPSTSTRQSAARKIHQAPSTINLRVVVPDGGSSLDEILNLFNGDSGSSTPPGVALLDQALQGAGVPGQVVSSQAVPVLPTPAPIPPTPSPAPIPTDTPMTCPLPECMRWPSSLQKPAGLQAIIDGLEPTLFPECLGATVQPGFPDCPADTYYSDALIMYLVGQGLAQDLPCTRKVYRTSTRATDTFAQLVGIMATRNNQVCAECIVVSGVESAFSAMHLHAPAQVGSNAAAVLTLTGDVQNMGKGVYTVEQSCFGLTDEIANALDQGLSYLNFHTAAFPSGEIRGQMYDIGTEIVSMYSFVGGTGDRGPKGRAQIHIIDRNVVCFEDLFFWNPQDFPLEVSLNGPGGYDDFFGAPGLIFLDRKINHYDSRAVYGTPWHCEFAFEETVTAILAEETYMNFTVHPDPFNSAPITIIGRVLREENVPMPASQEIVATFTAAPGVSTPATGTVTIRVYEHGICMTDLTISGMVSSFTGMHLHGPAAPGGSGGVLVNLGTPVFSSIGGTYKATFWCMGVDNFDVTRLVRMNETYLNVHSSAHPGGEIRSHLFFPAM